jgi:hypothetical protein
LERSVFEKARAGRVVTIATLDMETLGLGVNSQVTSIGYGVGVWAPGNTAKPKVVEVAEFTVWLDHIPIVYRYSAGPLQVLQSPFE